MIYNVKVKENGDVEILMTLTSPACPVAESLPGEVREKIKSVPDFPKELERNLIHLILSHQGKLEYASPVVPKTIEAAALYQADELSAKVNAYKNVITSEIRGCSQWTKFIMLAQTDLYQHNLDTDSEEKTNKSLFD